MPCILNISGAGFATICKSVFFDTTPFDTTPFIYLRVLRLLVCELPQHVPDQGLHLAEGVGPGVEPGVIIFLM